MAQTFLDQLVQEDRAPLDQLVQEDRGPSGPAGPGGPGPLCSCANLASSLSDYLFKLLLIGDSGVGKSCLLLRFAVSSSASRSSASQRVCVRPLSVPHLHLCSLCRTTPTQRATSAPSEWTSRSAPSSWTARPSSCRL